MKTLIKLLTAALALSGCGSLTGPDDQIRAVVDPAHAGGRRVAVHSYGAPGVKDAVRAGADSIEHGIELDDETLTELVRRRTVWVPTIDHNRYYIDAREERALTAGREF